MGNKNIFYYFQKLNYSSKEKSILDFTQWDHLAKARQKYYNNILMMHGSNNLPVWFNKLNNFYLDGSPSLVVMGGDSYSEGCRFKSRHRILDGHFSHIFVIQIEIMFV